VESIYINFTKEKLIIDGKQIKNPVIVSVPYKEGYPRRKIFNYEEGCCKQQLPKVSVEIKNLGRR